MSVLAVTIGTLGALFGVSHVVGREVKDRREGFNATIAGDANLAPEMPKPSTDPALLQQIPQTQTGNTMSSLPSYRQTDEVLFRGNDPFMPGSEQPYLRTKQKQYLAPKQEREMLPISTTGNVRQTTKRVSNQKILDRNPVPTKQGPAGVGYATGVQKPGKIWEYEAIAMGKDGVKNTSTFTPHTIKHNDAYQNTRGFLNPVYHFAPTLRCAPTFLQPRWFDRQDAKINRPVITQTLESQMLNTPKPDPCQLKHDRTHTEVGVMYKSLSAGTQHNQLTPADLLVDDKEDHVYRARNPGVSRPNTTAMLNPPLMSSQWRRKLESLDPRCLSVPHAPVGSNSHSQPSKLFTVYRKKRQDTKGPTPSVGIATSLSSSLKHPQVLQSTQKSSRKGEPFATAGHKEVTPSYISDKWMKPIPEQRVTDAKGNRPNNI